MNAGHITPSDRQFHCIPQEYRGAVMSNVLKFPLGVSRKAYARNRRTAAREMAAEKIDSQIDNRTPARPLSATAANGRLRTERHEVWRMAERATCYWRRRLEFESAVECVQSMGMPEGRLHAPVDPGYRQPMVDKWRAALVRQLLTPAWGVASVNWKQTTLASERRGYYCLDVKPERIERAIADDLAFLAAHPVRQSNRRSAKDAE
jgi:hypothetical protein